MVVTCLCALWCDVCRSYREGFFALAGARVFYGSLPPQHGHLKRLLEALAHDS